MGQPTRFESRTLNLSFLLLVGCFSCFLFTYPLRTPTDLLACAQDDFYYYLVIAKNLAAGRGSTFNGFTPTNGYHPLYEIVLWGFASLAHTLPGIFRWLAVLDVLSALCIFALCRAIFQRHILNPLLSNGLALVILYVSLFKIYHQMEVTLTLPLCFLLLVLIDRDPSRLNVPQWFGVGLSCAALMLSRLDSGILVALCGLGFLFTKSLRRSLTPGKIAAFLAGVIPWMAVYFAVNEHFFHMLMPISGAVKQAKTVSGFFWTAIPESASAETYVMFCAAFLGIGLLIALRKSLPPQTRVIASAGLLFPFVHWLTLFWVSDWKLWGWYSYSLRPAVAVTILLLARVLEQRYPVSAVSRFSAAVLICAVAVLFTARYRVDSIMLDIAHAAEAMKPFAAQHPGRYAMGDRAGMVGFELHQPLIQTEGLVMDKDYLNHILHREPLLTVLEDYNVRYYVGFIEYPQTKRTESVTGCFSAREPAQAGPNSPVMKAEICRPPIWQFEAPSGRTMIFDLKQPPANFAGVASQANRSSASN